MTTPPPYPPPSDLEREAERALAEHRAQYQDTSSPRARRNRALLALTALGFVACLMFGGVAAGYQLAGWVGAVSFGVIWIGMGGALLAWAIYTAPLVK